MANWISSEEWTKTFGGNYHDSANSVQQTSDSGYIIAGKMGKPYYAGLSDAWLIKTDANGSEQWNRTFGGSIVSWANSVQQTFDGGYIMLGFTGSYGAGHDAWLIKTYANGSEQWNRTFRGYHWDEGFSVQQTFDGGYILAGRANYIGYSNREAWLIKTDANGSMQWSKSFSKNNYGEAYSVQQTSDGGYILAGKILNSGDTGIDAMLIKTYSNGSQQWCRILGKTGEDIASSVRQTSDGGYIFAGRASDDAWIVKTDANGSEQWNKTLKRDLGYGALYSVQQTFDGGYIFAGDTTLSYGVGNPQAWLIKTDSSGNQQWNMIFGSPNVSASKIFSVKPTSDYGFILAGIYYKIDNYDAMIIKVNVTPQIIKGDVSGDGQITVVDALFVAQYTVGLRTLNSEQLAAADVNCDSNVNVVDALFIAQYTVGLRTSFC